MGAGAAGGEGHLRHHSAPGQRGPHVAPGRGRTPRPLCASPAAVTCWRTDASYWKRTQRLAGQTRRATRLSGARFGLGNRTRWHEEIIMVWEPEKECMQRERAAPVAARTAPGGAGRASTCTCPSTESSFDACQVDRTSFAALDDVPRLPFTSKADLQETIPMACSPFPCAMWCASTPRPACHSGGVHAQRHQDLVESGGACVVRRGREQGRRGADRLRLRPVDRRLRYPLWRRAHRGFSHSHIHGQHRPPNQDHAISRPPHWCARPAMPC